jgi:hypothetical protein
VMDGPRDALAVLGAESEHAENQQVERALEKCQSFPVVAFRHGVSGVGLRAQGAALVPIVTSVDTAKWRNRL